MHLPDFNIPNNTPNEESKPVLSQLIETHCLVKHHSSILENFKPENLSSIDDIYDELSKLPATSNLPKPVLQTYIDLASKESNEHSNQMNFDDIAKYTLELIVENSKSVLSEVEISSNLESVGFDDSSISEKQY